jgi:hypothetical protein
MPRTEYFIMSQKFDGVYEGRTDTWDFGWALAILINKGVSVIPGKNLISNIGFDSEGTHTRRPSRRESAVPTYAIESPLRHPPSTTADSHFERALLKNRFPLWRRLVATLPQPAQNGLREVMFRMAALAERRATSRL